MSNEDKFDPDGWVRSGPSNEDIGCAYIYIIVVFCFLLFLSALLCGGQK